MIYHVLMLLASTCSLFTMDPDLFELPMIKEEIYSEPFSKNIYPPEAIDCMMQKLSLKDQIAFTNTCTYLHRFRVHAHTVRPWSPTTQDTFFNDTICAVAFCAGTFLTCKVLEPYMLSIKELIQEALCTSISTMPPLLNISGGLAFIMCSPHVYRKISSALNYLETYQQKLAATHIADVITAQHNIAKRLCDRSLTTDSLHIDYYREMHTCPLIHAARKSAIPDVTIDIHNTISGVEPSPIAQKNNLKLCHLLAGNTHLKKLEVDISDWYSSSYSPVSIESLYEGLKRNFHLETLKLTNVTLSPKLLDSIFTSTIIKELTLNGCDATQTYTFEALTKNTALKKFALIYFTNHHSSIDDATVPSILDFMQNNTQLKSLTIKSTFLSHAAIQQLKTSLYKPQELVIVDNLNI